MGKVSQKREIALLVGEKGLKDLDHMNDVCLVGIIVSRVFQMKRVCLMRARNSAMLCSML